MADTPALAMQSALAPMTPSAPPLPAESTNVQHQRELVGKFEHGIEQQQQDFAAGQAALDPIRDRVLKVLESPNAAQAHLQKIKDAPKPEDYQKNALQFASAMAVLGAFAGKFTRAGGTASLDAFAGAIKGWQEGNLQAWHQGMEEWRANTEKTLANNQVELQKYRQIIENKRLTVDQMMAALNIESARFQNKVMFDATTNQNYEQAFRLTDTLEKNAQRLQGNLDFFGRSMTEAKQSVQSQVDALQKYPQLMQNMKPEEYMRLKGAAEQFGLQMPAPPTNIGQRQGTGVLGADRAQFISEFERENGRPPTSQEITKFEGDRAGEIRYQSTAGNYAARAETFGNEVQQFIPQALEASANLPRGKWVPINKLLQDWQQGRSDPAYNDFIAANNALLNAYTRTLNPTGNPRVADRLETHAIGLLSTATSPEAYRVQVQRIWKETQATKAAVAKTQEGRTPGDINAPMPEPTRNAPQPGDIQDGYRFKGGNPGDKANWEPAT